MIILADCASETFLPFDLELTYAAALQLTMANTLFPPDTESQSYGQLAHSILDEMIQSGNRVADARKRELTRIEGLFQELTRRVEQEGLRILTLADQGLTDIATLNLPDESQSGGVVSVAEPAMAFQSSARDYRPPSAASTVPPNIDFLDSIGISSNEFLSIVDQINYPGIPYGTLDVRPDWLSGEDFPSYSFD